MKKPAYLVILTPAPKGLKTADSLPIDYWILGKTDDSTVLADWARHLRDHYVDPSHIDSLRGNESRTDYLLNTKFPDAKVKPGPSVRAGDFVEMLVADLIEFHKSYWVPRLRWSGKVTRQDSPKGSDILGFLFAKGSIPDEQDELLVVECKARLSKDGTGDLQQAINHSAKDPIRLFESLNYLKQRFLSEKKNAEAERLERFQKLPDIPYRISYGAAAVYCNSAYSESDLIKSDATRIPGKNGEGARPHPNRNDLKLIVIVGEDLMSRVHKLYELAAT